MLFLYYNGMDKKIILTENQFKQLLGHVVKENLYKPHGIESLPVNVFKNRIDEGMYKTYSIDFVVRHFCQYVGFTDDYSKFLSNPDVYNGFITKVSAENGLEYIEFVSADDDDVLKTADEALRLCGYYMAFVEEYCKGYVQAGYEKRHEDTITLKTNKLYHITRRESLPRIMRDGIVPKSRNRKTTHLERTYLFTKDFGFDGFESMAEDLYDRKSTFGYAVIEVDVEGLDNVTFHYDPNTENGVYTTDNIPPSALKIKYQYRV